MKKLLNILILHVRFIYINYEIVFFFYEHVYIPLPVYSFSSVSVLFFVIS